MHETLQGRLQGDYNIVWSQDVEKSSSIRAPPERKKGHKSADRGQERSKDHTATHSNGIPFAAMLINVNEHSVNQAIPLGDAIPPVRWKPGRQRRWL